MNLHDKTQKALSKAMKIKNTQAAIAIRNSGVPNRYGEQKDITFQPPIYFYVISADSKTAEAQINEEAWMKDIELMTVTTSLAELQRVGLITNYTPHAAFSEGDRLYYNGTVYEIRDFHGDNPLGNQSTTLSILGRKGDK